MNVRTARITDARGIGRTQLASWHTMFPEAGIDASEYLAQFSNEQREARWHELLLSDKPRFVYVAENDQQEVVGFLHGAPMTPSESLPYASEIIGLHIRPGYRGKGLGKQLMSAFAHAAHQHQLPSMMLWVLAGNRARRFYERQGGQLIREEQGTMRKGDVEITVSEAAYGWHDLAPLL